MLLYIVSLCGHICSPWHKLSPYSPDLFLKGHYKQQMGNDKCDLEVMIFFSPPTWLYYKIVVESGNSLYTPKPFKGASTVRRSFGFSRSGFPFGTFHTLSCHFNAVRVLGIIFVSTAVILLLAESVFGVQFQNRFKMYCMWRTVWTLY